MTQVTQVASIDALFAMSIDDIADLPGFEVPCEGSYILNISLETKSIKKKPALEVNYEVVELVEPATPGETAVVGTKFSTANFIDNEYGLGNAKKVLATFAEFANSRNPGDIIAAVKDVRVAATLKHRKDKEDPSKIYANVSNITLA